MRGNHAYVADSFAGLQIIDVSNPARPVRLGGYRTSGMAGGVHVLGTYAYVSDRDFGLQVLDVSNPSRPVRVGRYAYKMGIAAGLEVADNYAFVCHSAEGLLVIEVSNPAKPGLAGSYKTTKGAKAVQVVGNTVYVVDHLGGLVILEVNIQAPLRMNPPFRSGDKLSLSWNGGAGIKLQTTPSLTAPNWQDVPGTDGASSVELPLTDPSGFFRLIKP